MHVAAFAPARIARLEDSGGVISEGFPLTSYYVDCFPAEITLPLLLAVYTGGGSEYEMRRCIFAISPKGERVGYLEFGWRWPDTPGIPIKYRVFAHQLRLRAPSGGIYRIGLYEHPEAPEPEFSFPIPVLKPNPLLAKP